MEAHQNNPYPTEKQKLNFAVKLGMSKRQIDNWFVNTRKRYYQDNPKVKKTKRKVNRELSIEAIEEISESSHSLYQSEFPKIEIMLDLEKFMITYCMCNIPNLVDFVQSQTKLSSVKEKQPNIGVQHYDSSEGLKDDKEKEISMQTSTKSIAINYHEIV